MRQEGVRVCIAVLNESLRPEEQEKCTEKGGKPRLTARKSGEVCGKLRAKEPKSTTESGKLGVHCSHKILHLHSGALCTPLP